MPRPFFPDPAFGWAYCIALGLLTCVAAYTDTRTGKIPNRLCLVILGVGLVANVARSIWMGAAERPLWLFDTGEWWLGLLDGLLFAIVGFLVAFGFMFAFWVFGLCGGGDVKLMAAIAVWLGFDLNLLRVWLMSLVVLFVWTLLKVFSRGFSPRRLKKTFDAVQRKPGEPAPPGRRPLRVTYSLPIAVATIVVLLWVYRFELLLAAPKAA